MRWGVRWWRHDRHAAVRAGRGPRAAPAGGAPGAAAPAGASFGGVSMSLPAGVERHFPLARLTTVRTGGAGEYFARAGSEAQLLELLAWADAEGAALSIVGSGSNL